MDKKPDWLDSKISYGDEKNDEPVSKRPITTNINQQIKENLNTINPRTPAPKMNKPKEDKGLFSSVCEISIRGKKNTGKFFGFFLKYPKDGKMKTVVATSSKVITTQLIKELAQVEIKRYGVENPKTIRLAGGKAVCYGRAELSDHFSTVEIDPKEFEIPLNEFLEIDQDITKKAANDYQNERITALFPLRHHTHSEVMKSSGTIKGGSEEGSGYYMKISITQENGYTGAPLILNRNNKVVGVYVYNNLGAYLGGALYPKSLNQPFMASITNKSLELLMKSKGSFPKMSSLGGIKSPKNNLKTSKIYETHGITESSPNLSIGAKNDFPKGEVLSPEEENPVTQEVENDLNFNKELTSQITEINLDSFINKPQEVVSFAPRLGNFNNENVENKENSNNLNFRSENIDGTTAFEPTEGRPQKIEENSQTAENIPPQEEKKEEVNLLEQQINEAQQEPQKEENEEQKEQKEEPKTEEKYEPPKVEVKFVSKIFRNPKPKIDSSLEGSYEKELIKLIKTFKQTDKPKEKIAKIDDLYKKYLENEKFKAYSVEKGLDLLNGDFLLYSNPSKIMCEKNPFFLMNGSSDAVAFSLYKELKKNNLNKKICIQIFADQTYCACGLLGGWRTQEEACFRDAVPDLLAALNGIKFVLNHREDPTAKENHFKYVEEPVPNPNDPSIKYTNLDTGIGYIVTTKLCLIDLAPVDCPFEVDFLFTSMPSLSGDKANFDVLGAVGWLCKFRMNSYVEQEKKPWKEIYNSMDPKPFNLEVIHKFVSTFYDRRKDGKITIDKVQFNNFMILVMFGNYTLPKSEGEINSTIQNLINIAKDTNGKILNEAKNNYRNLIRKFIRNWVVLAREQNVRYFVGGAVGCGAFENDPYMVSNIMAEEFIKYGGTMKFVYGAYAGNKDANGKVFRDAFDKAFSRKNNL